MYPEQLRPSLETQANYVAEWLELTGEVGRDRFSAALVQAVRDSEYFPVISKIRQHAGMGSKQQTAAGADAAWLYVQDYIRKWPDYGEGIGRKKDAPALPPRIAHAVRMVGGLARIEFALKDSLPFVRKDFSAAWENYEQSAAAYHDLQLEAPLLPKLLAAANGQHPNRESSNTSGRAIEAAAKPIPPASKPYVGRAPLTESEIADLKRRALEVEAQYRAANGVQSA
jgi:hypothetical protein